MSDTLPIDCYAGQPRAWLQARERALLDAISEGARTLSGENDGGLSVTFAFPPQVELRAVRYALNGRAAEDLAAGGDEESAAGENARAQRPAAPGGFVPHAFF